MNVSDTRFRLDGASSVRRRVGVDALQSAAIITSGPFAFVCFLAMLGLIREFSSRFGCVILQDSAWIVGSRPEQSSSPDAVPGDDDD